jgi:thiol:disulfide interchange protein DsbD
VDPTLLERPFAALPVLFGAGLLTSLTPCVYPMIPITAGILGGAGAATRSRRTTALYTGLYVLGLALVYALLGLIAGLSGTLFGTISANPWAYATFGALLMLAALAMLDVVPVLVPERLMALAGRGGSQSPLAVFVMGATSGLVAAPCGAPAFAAVLTWVSGTQSGLWGFIYLFVFSLGMTALLVAVGLSAGSLAALPRAGQWMAGVKKVAGLVMLAMGAFYFFKMGTVW